MCLSSLDVEGSEAPRQVCDHVSAACIRESELALSVLAPCEETNYLAEDLAMSQDVEPIRRAIQGACLLWRPESPSAVRSFSSTLWIAEALALAPISSSLTTTCRRTFHSCKRRQLAARDYPRGRTRQARIEWKAWPGRRVHDSSANNESAPDIPSHSLRRLSQQGR